MLDIGKPILYKYMFSFKEELKLIGQSKMDLNIIEGEKTGMRGNRKESLAHLVSEMT